MADQKSHDNPLELKFSRTLEADPEFVFKALTHPDLIKEWFGPHGYTCPVVEVDLRVGGNYHIEMKPPEGEIIKLNGVYNFLFSACQLYLQLIFRNINAFNSIQRLFHHLLNPPTSSSDNQY